MQSWAWHRRLDVKRVGVLTALAAISLVIGCSTSGMSGKYRRVYDGERRPAENVVRVEGMWRTLENDSKAEQATHVAVLFSDFDGHPLDGKHRFIESLGGTHTVRATCYAVFDQYAYKRTGYKKATRQSLIWREGKGVKIESIKVKEPVYSRYRSARIWKKLCSDTLTLSLREGTEGYVNCNPIPGNKAVFWAGTNTFPRAGVRCKKITVRKPLLPRWPLLSAGSGQQ